mmetsp:Transcript_20997/g.44034  ORF Transcript_20997/g.44034 Transcript_20997/m.44034 type:complete len:216 (+) Transcript_20997:3-650(+)
MRSSGRGGRPTPAMSLLKQPWKVRLNMASGSVLKYLVPAGVSTAIWVRAMAKTYTIMRPSMTVSTTERVAAPMARTRIRTSGRNRSILATRATRVSRRSRSIRSTEESKNTRSKSVKLNTTKRTQVSSTMKKAKRKSKMNQKSRIPRHFDLKAMNRIMISTVKIKQSRFSTKMMPGSALMSKADSLIVDSMPIQIEFSRMTNMVPCSNQWDRAMY